MLTKDDLQAIGQLIKAEIEPVKQEMRAGFQTLDKKIDTVEMKVETVNTTLQQSIKDNAAFFNHEGVFFDTIKNDLEKRIEIIEETLGMDEQPHKN